VTPRHVCLVVVVAIASLGAKAQQGSTELPRWLSGCWELRSGARLIEERWTTPRGGLMLGTSRTSRNDSIVEYEQVRIETRAGRVYYVASPSRQATTEFTATSLLDSIAVFENPEHDFPKKVIYRRLSSDSIVASIEGPRGGQTRTISFPYRRVSCDA